MQVYSLKQRHGSSQRRKQRQKAVFVAIGWQLKLTPLLTAQPTRSASSSSCFGALRYCPRLLPSSGRQDEGRTQRPAIHPQRSQGKSRLLSSLLL